MLFVRVRDPFSGLLFAAFFPAFTGPCTVSFGATGCRDFRIRGGGIAVPRLPFMDASQLFQGTFPVKEKVDTLVYGGDHEGTEQYDQVDPFHFGPVSGPCGAEQSVHQEDGKYDDRREEDKEDNHGSQVFQRVLVDRVAPAYDGRCFAACFPRQEGDQKGEGKPSKELNPVVSCIKQQRHQDPDGRDADNLDPPVDSVHGIRLFKIKKYMVFQDKLSGETTFARNRLCYYSKAAWQPEGSSPGFVRFPTRNHEPEDIYCKKLFKDYES
jgi:hypothetical protein